MQVRKVVFSSLETVFESFQFSDFKVAKHSFGSLWLYVICQIMARKKLLLTSWNFDWQVKTDDFLVSMATWTIEYNLKISLFLSLHKIRSLDFPINLHTAYYN